MSSSHTALEGNLRCSVCFEIFKDPVVLHCGHSFCKACLEKYWAQKPVKNCPLCRQITICSPFKSLALKGVSEFFVAEKRRRISAQGQGVLCVVHGLKHELFCTEDQKLVCLHCVSEDHEKHKFCSINRAAEDHMNKLQESLQELISKLQTLISKTSTAATELKSQGQQTEAQIKEEFKKLYQFLKEEEEARISALRDEQKKKTERITKKTAEFEGLHSLLSEQIQNIQADLGRDESLFLHNFKATEESFRVQFTVPDLKFDSGPLIDVAKHMGNLRYRVWEKMKQFCPYYPVILDPKTKAPNLEVSPDLTSIRCSGLPVLNSPEKGFCCILGSEGFMSGVHTWQVDVDACEHWALGVVTESAKRLQNLSSCPILITCINGKCSWTSGRPKIKKVCVSLNMEKKLVVFSDHLNATMKSYIYTYTESMYPCFIPLSQMPMKILPSKSRSCLNYVPSSLRAALMKQPYPIYSGFGPPLKPPAGIKLNTPNDAPNGAPK